MTAIVGYLVALRVREVRERTYRTYVTDFLKGFGRVEGRRWADIAYPEPERPEKPADEIVADMMRRIGASADEPT